MDAETLKALQASIKHWEENVAAKHPDDAKLGMRSCALCHMFAVNKSPGCVGCPVYAVTGLRSCENTPYQNATDAKFLWEEIVDHDKEYLTDPREIEDAKAEWVKAAQAEVDFLKGLLPDGI